MTQYLKTYIELKKDFELSNGSPESIRAIYTFKEELEWNENREAKEVLDNSIWDGEQRENRKL